MKQWYYVKNGERFGPVQKSQLLELYQNDELKPDDLVWEEGTENWVPASSVLTKSPIAPPPLTSINPQANLPVFTPVIGQSTNADYGDFLCWGIGLTLVPYVGFVAIIVLAILICMELSAVQKEIKQGKLSSSTYGNLHPAIGFILAFCCSIIFYPFLMYWRNQSGYFKPQPHAVWFSILINVITFLVGIGGGR